MDGEMIFGTIILAGTSWVCGLVFWLIGHWASKRKDPMHFYSGTTVDPRKITDVADYNHANAHMWKCYSIPYWIAGIAAFFNLAASGVVLGLACFPGILFLVLRYNRICKEFFVR